MKIIGRDIVFTADDEMPDCLECDFCDYTTCKFDNSVELPGGLDYRHCCDRYEFEGFLEVDDDST